MNKISYNINIREKTYKLSFLQNTQLIDDLNGETLI